MRPENLTPAPDTMEFLHRAKEKSLTLDAHIVALDYPDNVPTWVLSFDGLDGVRGLVPASESGLPDAGLMVRFVGQQVRVKVKAVDRKNKLAACSRREAVAEAAAKLLPALAENPEQVMVAVVRCVVPGSPPKLLVDVGGGVLAEVPSAQAGVWLTKPLGAQYAPGQRVRVKITRVDPQTGLVEASVKKARPDPWEAAGFRRGQFLACTVHAVRNGIVFLEPDAAPGVLGIAPAPLVGEVARGDRVTAAVASFDRANRKLRLRLRGRLA